MSSGIYKITNKVNGKVYIGQSKNLEKRFQQHRDHYLYKDRAQCLYKAMDKYGFDNFDFEIVQYCPTEFLDIFEKYYINLYDSYNGKGYNMTIGGDGVKNREQCHGVYCINTGIAYYAMQEAEASCALPKERIYRLCKLFPKEPNDANCYRQVNYDKSWRFCYIEDIHIVLEGNNYQGTACIVFPTMQIVGSKMEASRLCGNRRRAQLTKVDFDKANGVAEKLCNRFMTLVDFLSMEDSTDITFEELCAKYYIPTDKKEHLAFINTKIDNLMQEITTTGVYAFTTNGDCVGIYASLKECAQALGVSKPNIARSANHEVDKVGKYIFRCVNI